MAGVGERKGFLSIGPTWTRGQVELQAQLNEKLSTIIAKAGNNKLFATTLSDQSTLAETREAKNAANMSVELIGSSRPLGYAEKSSDEWLNFLPHCFYRNLPTVTGRIDVVLAHGPDYAWGALNMQDAFCPGSKLVLFNHKFPENLTKTDKKNVRSWASKADLVISFEKEIFDSYNCLYNNINGDEERIDHRHVEIRDLTLELLEIDSKCTTPRRSASLEPVAEKNSSSVISSSREKTPPKAKKGQQSEGESQHNRVDQEQVVQPQAIASLSAKFSSLALGTQLSQNHEWYDKVTPTLKKFHDDHARFPEKAVKAVRPFIEGTMKLIEGKLREKGLCERFEYTGSAFENVMINENDIEFDMMVIMSKLTELESEAIDDDTKGYFVLKPKDDVASKYSKMIHSPDKPVVAPEKVVKLFFSALQKALNDTGTTSKAKLRKHGPAVQMDVYHDVNKTQKWLSVDIVPAFQIRDERNKHGEIQLFVAKPYVDVKTATQSWRRSFSVEEKLKFKEIDKGDGCRRMSVRILKAIRKPPQSVKRKTDSSFSHITSFMIKNALFHENDDKSLNWAMDQLGPRTIGLIDRLATYLAVGNFPHYFLPGINIVAGLEEGPRVNLANRLRRLVSSHIELCNVIGLD